MGGNPTPQQALDILEGAQADPVAWCKEVLGVELWPAQEQIIEAVRDNKETDVASCHGAGKSFVAACIVLWFLYTHPDSIVITTAPTDRQVRGILWREINRLHRKAKYKLAGDIITQQIKLSESWLAWGFTAPDYDPDRFQGFHARHILVVVDEACGVSEPIFVGIDGVLTSQGSRTLRIGNPTAPTAPWAKLWTGNKHRIKISAFDTPNFTKFGITEKDFENGTWQKKIKGDLPMPDLITPEWSADKYTKWGPGNPYYESRVRGRFPRSSEDSLIPVEWIEAAKLRTIEPTKHDPVRLGLDVSRGGGDETSCYKNHGGRVRAVFNMRGVGTKQTMSTVGKVRAAIKETGAVSVGVDSVGIGAGVYDRLEEEGEPAVSVVFGAGAQNSERYVNLKAELYWREREAYEKGLRDIDPEDEELAAQASSMRWFVTSAGKTQIEPKKITKKRTGCSPDRFEATVYATATEEDVDGGFWVL